MKYVIAKKMGFYGNVLRQKDAKFYVDDDFEAGWIELVEPDSVTVPDGRQGRPSHDGGEVDLTVKQIKDKLDQLGVSYPANANKETLTALLAEHEA